MLKIILKIHKYIHFKIGTYEITKAIVFRNNMALQHNEKVELLKREILNYPLPSI